MKKHFIVNVGRQLGSGGRIIGSRIAKDFDIKFYDKELLDLAAQESGFNKKFFERNDEHRGFAKTIYSAFAPIFGNSTPYTNQLSDESLFKFQSDAIRKAAAQDSCVFVGRCAVTSSGKWKTASTFSHRRYADRIKGYANVTTSRSRRLKSVASPAMRNVLLIITITAQRLGGWLIRTTCASTLPFWALMRQPTLSKTSS